jgi:hypothetical protein
MAMSSVLLLWAAILIFLRMLLVEVKFPRVSGFILALALPLVIGDDVAQSGRLDARWPRDRVPGKT